MLHLKAHYQLQDSVILSEAGQANQTEKSFSFILQHRRCPQTLIHCYLFSLKIYSTHFEVKCNAIYNQKLF